MLDSTSARICASANSGSIGFSGFGSVFGFHSRFRRRRDRVGEIDRGIERRPEAVRPALTILGDVAAHHSAEADRGTIRAGVRLTWLQRFRAGRREAFAQYRHDLSIRHIVRKMLDRPVRKLYGRHDLIQPARFRVEGADGLVRLCMRIRTIEIDAIDMIVLIALAGFDLSLRN
jgi:hypothetical protein